jgi:hypothetical protein
MSRTQAPTQRSHSLTCLPLPLLPLPFLCFHALPLAWTCIQAARANNVEGVAAALKAGDNINQVRHSERAEDSEEELTPTVRRTLFARNVHGITRSPPTVTNHIRVLSIWALDLPNTLSAAALQLYMYSPPTRITTTATASHIPYTPTPSPFTSTYPPARLATLPRSAGAEARAR